MILGDINTQMLEQEEGAGGGPQWQPEEIPALVPLPAFRNMSGTWQVNTSTPSCLTPLIHHLKLMPLG